MNIIRTQIYKSEFYDFRFYIKDAGRLTNIHEHKIR